MNLLFSILTGILFSVGFYLMMARNTFRLVLGILVLSQAVNTLLFSTGKLSRAGVPIVFTENPVVSDYPDPLPQALILTAIVISFAATAFAVALANQSFLALETDDPDEMREAES